MRSLTKTSFFISLQKNENNLSILKSRYDKFAALLFSESTATTGKAAFRNMLIYTRVELLALESLTEVSEKKCGNLFS